MNIVFENPAWIVVDKSAGWLTTPARFKDDPRPCLGRELQARVGHQIFPVHRLDFEVSGLVLFAKTADAHRVAQRWFEKMEIGKTYLAQTAPGSDASPREWQTWNSKLQRGKKRTFVSPNGQESRTRARVLEVHSDHWLWELKPITGRPHQLRVELARHGTPILGDVLYGGPPGAAHVIRLRAVQLDLGKISETDRAGLPETLEVSRNFP